MPHSNRTGIVVLVLCILVQCGCDDDTSGVKAPPVDKSIPGHVVIEDVELGMTSYHNLAEMQTGAQSYSRVEPPVPHRRVQWDRLSSDGAIDRYRFVVTGASDQVETAEVDYSGQPLEAIQVGPIRVSIIPRLE